MRKEERHRERERDIEKEIEKDREKRDIEEGRETLRKGERH